MARAKNAKLKSIPGGKGKTPARGSSELAGLFSGKVTRAAPKSRQAKKKLKPTEELPGDLRFLSDVFAAGRAVQKELSFKVRYAEQRVKDYCLRRFSELFAASGTRPPSIEYTGEHSRFMFTQTERTTLTLDKVEELRDLGIPIDEYTELRGIRINYEAIRRHKLEEKLQKALSEMGLRSDILEECFVPNVELNESFYNVLAQIIRESLREGEELPEKLHEVLQILRPANQVRNLELPGYDARKSFDLVMKAEIAATEEEEEPEVA
ncbi:MAG: hypothetical protein A2X94_08625 [Bdellovibrionales bacterium GWB1_55_8]|nr:MAG: hypothetical protein A2X94_08625 [Bdellovibrionales bacterium GWB1_55_8]